MNYFLSLDLRDKKVLIVGAGAVARRRCLTLLAHNARVVVVAPEIHWDDSRVTFIQRGFVPDDLDGCWYVIAATNDTIVNRQVTAAAFVRRIFCVNAEDRTLGSAHTPAMTQSNNITTAWMTGNPKITKQLRPAWELFVHIFSHYFPDNTNAGDDQGVPRRCDLHDGTPSSSSAGIPNDCAWLSPNLEHHLRGLSSSVTLIGSGPGAVDLLTLRAVIALAASDIIITDRLVHKDLLQIFEPHRRVIDVGKTPYQPSPSQEDIHALMIEHARSGQRVARLKGGDPFIFGRGYEEIQALCAADIPVHVIPGLSSAIGVPTAAGIPLTHRGLVHQVTILTGHLAPDDHRSHIDWKQVAALPGTIVILMGRKHFQAHAQILLRWGKPAETFVQYIFEGTFATEQRFTTTLGQSAQGGIPGAETSPAIIIIGEVIGLSTLFSDSGNTAG